MTPIPLLESKAFAVAGISAALAWPALIVWAFARLWLLPL